jgi:predicted membrane protein
MTDQQQGAPENTPANYQRSSQTWRPLLIVGAILLVITVVANNTNSIAQDEAEATTTISDFKEVAVMGGVQRKNLTAEFRGGEATAVMGGIDIDLRDAQMEKNEVVLDVSSVMGGVKIRVPENWTVVSRVSTIMGGFKNDTRRPPTEEHRLILKGTVVMGGLKISN